MSPKHDRETVAAASCRRRRNTGTFHPLLASFALIILAGNLAAQESEAKVIIQTGGEPAKKPRIYSATAETRVLVGEKFVEHEIRLKIDTIQGSEGSFVIGIVGDAVVEKVDGDRIVSWAVRKEDGGRFLELVVAEEVRSVAPLITLRSPERTFPGEFSLTHLVRGGAASFTNTLRITFAEGVAGEILESRGFLSLAGEEEKVYHTTGDGSLRMRVFSDTGVPPPAVLRDARLSGVPDPASETIHFRLTGTAVVREPSATIDLLRGQAALIDRPRVDGFAIRLVEEEGKHLYRITFDRPGTFPIDLEFAAPVAGDGALSRSIDFGIEGEGVIPVSLSGLGSEIEFSRGNLTFAGDTWTGFLPASGQVDLQWKPVADPGSGRLFFSTSGLVETRIGNGLVAQTHEIRYRVLQGKLRELTLRLVGSGQVVAVTGENLLSWAIADGILTVTLNEAIEREGTIRVGTQSGLDALPATVTPVRLEPVDSIRHSGFVRLANRGSVKLEPVARTGVTQLSPDKFPGEPESAWQVFVFRFPAAAYEFGVACDRIEPEVHVSEITLHQLSEGERTLRAAIELDIRDAAIREWDILVPADYSVVSVTGAGISDYLLASEAGESGRNLKVIYAEDVEGRKLIHLVLEKNVPAQTEEWTLPVLVYPGAASVRGDLGLAAFPGFRIGVSSTDRLVERPLASFPGESRFLQHHFRIREAGWSAGLSVEVLEKSIQADVFHLYSLSEGTAYASILLNYFLTGSPSTEFRLQLPEGLENVVAEGKDIRGQRIEDGVLTVTLHQAVIGAYTLLVTFEEAAAESLTPGRVTPVGIERESGFVQIVSPEQVAVTIGELSDSLLRLDQLELPPEFRLLTASPSLGIWQYGERPFALSANLNWLEPDRTLDQVVEFAEAVTLISREKESVTDLVYYVKSRDNRPLSIRLPPGARIWDVRSNGRNLPPRQVGDVTQIPLRLTGKGGNIAEVRMRLGNTVAGGELSLPAVEVPVLKTGWRIRSESGKVTNLKGGSRLASRPPLPPAGMRWIGDHGLLPLCGILVAAGLGFWLRSRPGRRFRMWSPLAFALAVGLGVWTSLSSYHERVKPEPLEIQVPVLSPGEEVAVEVETAPLKGISLSTEGIVLLVLGAGLVAAAYLRIEVDARRRVLISLGAILAAFGILLFANGGYLFFALISLILFFRLLLPEILSWGRRSPGPVPAATAGTALLVLLLPAIGATEEVKAAPGYRSWDVLEETWTIGEENGRLRSKVEATLAGEPGDRFLLLRSPAILSELEKGDLLLRKTEGKGGRIDYFLVIPPSVGEEDGASVVRSLSFSYQLDIPDPKKGFALPTGVSAVHRLEARTEEPGWEFVIPTAARIRQGEGAASAVLIPRAGHQVSLRPRERDPAREPTEFFVESRQLYVPSAGVVDGIHRFEVRPSLGLVHRLRFRIPPGFTVSEVAGPVSSWQYDPEQNRLTAEIEPPQRAGFSVRVETQSGLSPFPAEVSLLPLMVEESDGQTGLLGMAFREDAQPEAVEVEELLPVNLEDFPATLTSEAKAVLHRAYRFRENGGTLVARLGEVAPEIRVAARSLLSLGDENLLLEVDFAVDIARAGIFQLSFPLPAGFEVNAISGESLDHWSEVDGEGGRTIVLHLSGKTQGRRNFSVSLNAAPPSRDEVWNLPRFAVTEANRQIGELIIQPAAGIRLGLNERQNVSELDPRELGAKEKGALAFRLLQKDWTIGLDIETLAPRVTGEVLHDVTVRDAQVRTSVAGKFLVENAAIRTLRVRLPVSDEGSVRTVRASGDSVSGIVKGEGDDGLWEIQLKRWLIGDLELRLEWEERVSAENGRFERSPILFPEVRQLRYFLAVRPTGRLEARLAEEAQPWRRVDWTSIPRELRDSGNRIAPGLSLKGGTHVGDLLLELERHSLSDALKLRMTRGAFRTVVSPYGTRLTSAELEVEVIQRSHLTMTLPPGSELGCLFVNGESVSPVKLTANEWRFPVLPDTNGRKAGIEVIFLEPGEPRDSIEMRAPLFDVPMENISWEVLSPPQLKMRSVRGNLDYLGHSVVESRDRSHYLELAEKRRKEQAAEAVTLLEKANELLQRGQQTLARQTLESVANRSGLDAASNEDARVQLETLKTRQVLVGLNSRRQRMYLDRSAEETFGSRGEQLRESASVNPVIQMGDLNFRPGDLSQLLQGNSNDELAAFQKIASRIVRQQRGEDGGMLGLDVAPPYEGNRYRFERGVQVQENAPLTLKMGFSVVGETPVWRIVLAALMVVLLVLGLLFSARLTRDV